MCLLIAATKFPEYDLLKAAEEQNSHGIGIAYLTSKGVKYYKGITLDELMKFRGLQTHMLIHFRIATVGEKVPQLCHPFPITKDVELNLEGTTNAVLGHNGTVSSWKDYMLNAISWNNPVPPGHHWSDTRGLAFLVHTYGAPIINLLDGQRIAILSDGEKPEYGPRGVAMYGNWHVYQEDAVWTSLPMKYRVEPKNKTVHINQVKHNHARNDNEPPNWKTIVNGQPTNNLYVGNPSGTGQPKGYAPPSIASNKSYEQEGTKEIKEAATVSATTREIVRVVQRKIDWEGQGYIGYYSPEEIPPKAPGGLVPQQAATKTEQYVRLHSRSEEEFMM